MKKQNGITLIALIITIIVLLILAVVAIGAVQDSDIIGHAEDAAKKYNAAAEEEEKLLENYVKEIEGVLPKTAAEKVAEKNIYIAANPTEYSSETDNDYGDPGDAYILYKAVDIIEKEMGFIIKNRESNVYDDALDFEKPVDMSVEEVDSSAFKYNFIVPVTYNGGDYTIVLNVYYNIEATESAVLGISLR